MAHKAIRRFLSLQEGVRIFVRISQFSHLRARVCEHLFAILFSAFLRISAKQIINLFSTVLLLLRSFTAGVRSKAFALAAAIQPISSTAYLTV